MNRCLTIVLALICLSGPIMAQKSTKDFKVVKGPELNAKQSTIDEVIGSIGGKAYVVRMEKGKPVIESITDKASVGQALPLADLTYNTLDKQFKDAFIIRDRLFLRFVARDRKKNLLYSIIDEYDPENLKFKENVSTDSEDIEAGWGAFHPMNELSENGFDVSNDESFAVEYSSPFENGKKASETVDIRVFNSNMKVVWSQNFTIPYPNNKFQIESVVADDKGNVHMLGIEYLDKEKGAERGASKVKYHVISFFDEGSRQKDYELQLEGKYITDSAIGINAEGTLITCGFYGNSSSAAIDGSFMLRIDIMQQKILSSSMKEFSKEFIQMGMSERQTKRSDKKEEKGKDLALSNYDLNHLVLLDDGGWLLLAEEFFFITHRVSNGHGGTVIASVDYYYNDIIGVKSNAQGEIEWNAKIPKNQSSSGLTSVLSYAWTSCNGKFYLVYNTAPGRDKNIVQCAVIDENGEIEIQKVMGSEDDELNMHPQYSGQTTDCQMLLYSARKKTYQFSLMNIE